jgi:hypothetical protein
MVCQLLILVSEILTLTIDLHKKTPFSFPIDEIHVKCLFNKQSTVISNYFVLDVTT